MEDGGMGEYGKVAYCFYGGAGADARCMSDSRVSRVQIPEGAGVHQLRA